MSASSSSMRELQRLVKEYEAVVTAIIRQPIWLSLMAKANLVAWLAARMEHEPLQAEELEELEYELVEAQQAQTRLEEQVRKGSATAPLFAQEEELRERINAKLKAEASRVEAARERLHEHQDMNTAKAALYRLKDEKTALNRVCEEYKTAQRTLPIGDLFGKFPPARNPRRLGHEQGTGDLRSWQRSKQSRKEELALGKSMGLRAAQRYWGVRY